MSTLQLVIGCVIIWVVIFCVGLAAPDTSWTTNATVSRVIDGDTCEVIVATKLRVRLLDCWAPESKIDPRVPTEQQKAELQRGLASKENLAKLMLGKRVRVQIPLAMDGDVSKSITLGRVLGRVWVDGDEKSVNQIQVEQGFATEKKPHDVD